MAENYKLKPGINICTNDEYHGDKNYLSSTNLKHLLKDPAEFKRICIDLEKDEVPKSRQNAYDEGSYAHSLILEPEMVEKEYAFFTGFRKHGNDWEAFKNANKGKIILSKPQKHRVESWVESYKGRKIAVDLVKGGEAELSLTGQLNDVNIKVRADYINVDKGYIADVKTTAYSTDVDSFKYVVSQLSYGLSGALYTKMFSQHYGKPFDFYFIVLGKKDGMCEVFKLSEESLQEGYIQINNALKVYKECKKSGIWKSGKDSKAFISDDDYEVLYV